MQIVFKEEDTEHREVQFDEARSCWPLYEVRNESSSTVFYRQAGTQESSLVIEPGKQCAIGWDSPEEARVLETSLISDIFSKSMLPDMNFLSNSAAGNSAKHLAGQISSSMADHMNVHLPGSQSHRVNMDEVGQVLTLDASTSNKVHGVMLADGPTKVLVLTDNKTASVKSGAEQVSVKTKKGRRRAQKQYYSQFFSDHKSEKEYLQCAVRSFMPPVCC